ncbi:MAG: hypothetical protein QXS02_04940 [Candidatus Thermoplasmatota archaeon]
MEKDKITYKTLRHIQETEKNSPSISKIDNQFYYNVNLYLNSLQESLEKEKNPERLKILNNEIQNIKKLVINIYEQREKKIVHAALSASRGGKPDIRNLIEPERRLYDNITNFILSSREEILRTSKDEEVIDNKKEEIKIDTKEEENKKDDLSKKKEDEIEKKQPSTNPIVQVLTDIPSFVGTDMKTYTLKKDDILSLPRDMSDQLIKRKVIKIIK